MIYYTDTLISMDTDYTIRNGLIMLLNHNGAR